MNFALINGILAALKNLSASWVTSGRFSLTRMPDMALGKIMVGAGAGSSPTENDKPGVFFPATYGSDIGTTGQHVGYLIDAVAENAFIELTIPWDYNAITSIEVVGIVIAADVGVGFPMYLICDVDWGALDERYNSNESAATPTNVEGHSTVNDLISWDISGILAGIAAGDIVGIKVYHSVGAGAQNETNARILGVRLRYS